MDIDEKAKDDIPENVDELVGEEVEEDEEEKL